MPTSLRRRFTSGVSAAALLAGTFMLAPVAQADSAQPAADTEPTTTIAGGTMDWGVKSSFVGYISSPFAGGGWEMDGVTRTDSGFSWPVVAGAEIDADNLGELTFDGSVRFHAHDEVLDLSFADPIISFAGSSPILTVEAQGREFVSTTVQGDLIDYGRVELATLSAPVITEGEDSVLVSFESATLTDEGVKAFGGFYKAGDELDPISMTLATETVEPPAPTLPGCGPDAAPADLDATPGYLGWGLKESFLGYLLSPRGGGELNGCDGAWGTDILNYTLASGAEFDPEKPGVLEFDGTVNLYAHNGGLNLNFASPTITFTDSQTAVMSIGAAGAVGGQGGQWLDTPVVYDDFARLGNVEITTNDDGSVTVASDSVTSGAGTQAILGAYPAGTELAPISITINEASVVAPAEEDPVDEVPVCGPDAAPADLDATPGYLGWGLKESFLGYLLSPRGGGELNGCDGAWGTDILNYTLSDDTKFDPENPGALEFVGTLNLNAHGGVLNIDFTDPVITFTDVETATMSLTAKGSLIGAENGWADSPVLVEDFARLADVEIAQAEDGTVTITSESVTSGEGTAFVLGSYEPGTELAPMSITVNPSSVVQEPVDPV
ncbi:MAG: HtaA domain-containing protein, partial [Flaviflexus sp.]|uniref:HtaA domain-containing protein n=1 Tax=Flaviflexus sp. TaxID=1969482 RepID=UPI003F90CFD4